MNSNHEKESMRIGIIGGTFDPVHNGHVYLAEKAYQNLQLDSVLFMPAFIPPHKQGQVTASVEDRLAMLRLSLSDLPYVEISDFEIKQAKVMYTVDTLREMRKMYSPNTELFFIVGSDFVYEYQTWKNPDELLRLATFAVAVRPGFSFNVLPPSTVLLEGDFPEISSSEIRNRLIEHSDCAGYLPTAVNDYIQTRRIY